MSALAQITRSESADRLPASQRGQKFLRGFPEYRMARIGSDLGQRFQNKPALVHCRMRNLQARGDIYRQGLIKCRDREQPARYVQLCERLAQVGRTISQVRSQRQISGFAHQASLAAKGGRIQQKPTVGVILDYLALESDSPRWQPKSVTFRCDEGTLFG